MNHEQNSRKIIERKNRKYEKMLKIENRKKIIMNKNSKNEK